MIVAIDGPAGSGKSTTARLVARRLGFLYLDTGAMFRAVALAFRRADLPVTAEAADRLLARTEIEVEQVEDGMIVLLDGEDVSEEIRSREVSALASEVSALAPVRQRLLEEQRRIGARFAGPGRGLVVDGRDIGTVVFPEAEVKVFLVADPAERARRRHQELASAGRPSTEAEVLDELRDRDQRDATRAIAPLRKAADAVELDTTHLTVEEQVEAVIGRVRRRDRGERA